MSTPPARRRVKVFGLTYGEPAENDFSPQFTYSHLILNRLTRRVAPIPKFVTPFLAARRARIRCRNFRARNWHSPLDAISEEQMRILGRMLTEMRPDTDFDVELVREFRPPLLPDILERLAAIPPDDILVLPLYVAESDFTTGISRTDFANWYHQRRTAHRLPGPKYVVGFGFAERFADAMADFIWSYCRANGWSEEKCRSTVLILGAHGTVVTLPAGMNSGAQETGNLFRLIRRRLKDRFGWMRIGWLNHQLGGMWTCPAAADSAREAYEKGFRNVVYFPFGFIGDNGESMLEGRDALAEFNWDDLLYLPCPNSDEGVLRVMAEMAIERLDGPPENWETVGQGNPAYERPEMPAPPGKPGFLRFNGPVLAACAGVFWAAIGVMLTARGVISTMAAESATAMAAAAAVGAFIAWYKGTRILAKLAVRNLQRLRGIPQPSPLIAMFSKPSWLVIAFFVAVGIGLRYVPMAAGVRGAILLGVGGAMLVGAATYVRHFRMSRPIGPAFAPKRAAALSLVAARV